MTEEAERCSVTLRLRPLTLLDRIWYRYIRAHPPLATSRTDSRWARLVPYRFRGFHENHARARGYFWFPCPLCDRPFGGHEWGKDIPDPLTGPGGYMGICSKCSRARPRTADEVDR